MPHIEYLYFNSCPSQSLLRSNLEAALASLDTDSSISLVDMETLDPDDPRRGFGSPSILVDGKDLFGGQSGATTMSCRLYSNGTPTPDEIKQRLLSLLTK